MINNLPEISFCETDTAAVEAAVIADYERITGKTLYPGDPERLFCEGVAYLIAKQLFEIDYAGKMDLVSYAVSDYLDHVGALLNTTRLGSAHAKTTLRYTLTEPVSWDITIPAGSRATADGSLHFATNADAVIAAGESYLDVAATCLEAGTVGNGLQPGQINTMVDRITYVASCKNTTLTLGGTNAEDDDRFRGRVHLAPERLSTCGPEGAYEYHAKSASPDISDVAVWSPEEGRIRLSILCTGGALPSNETIALAAAAVAADKKRRPLTDTVDVVSPDEINFTVAGTFWIRTSYAARSASIQTKVAVALDEYIAWQRVKLGRDITPSELTSRVQSVEGIQRVALTAPDYTALDPWQLAVCDSAALVYGGLSDD